LDKDEGKDKDKFTARQQESTGSSDHDDHHGTAPLVKIVAVLSDHAEPSADADEADTETALNVELITGSESRQNLLDNDHLKRDQSS
jgi:hypothetical protein